GNLLASAIAYRLFFWMLPLALFVTAGLGFAEASSSGESQRVAGDMGFGKSVVSVVAKASDQAERSRWLLLVFALVGLYTAGAVARHLDRAPSRRRTLDAARARCAVSRCRCRADAPRERVLPVREDRELERALWRTRSGGHFAPWLVPRGSSDCGRRAPERHLVGTGRIALVEHAARLGLGGRPARGVGHAERITRSG